MYFGKFENWLKEIKKPLNTDKLIFIHNFALELNLIGQQILEANPTLQKAVEKRKDNEHNLIGSVVSYFLQEWENRILETVYLYCVENRYIINNVAVLCADGLMIEDKYYKDELLDKLVELVQKEHGFNVKFTTKDFNQDYLSILDDHQIKSDNDCDGVFNDKEAAETLYNLYPHFVCCKGILYVFDEELGLWSDKEELILKVMSKYDESLYLLSIDIN
jgi:hypothetical protein